MFEENIDGGYHGLKRHLLIKRATSTLTESQRHEWFSEYLCLHLMEVLWWETRPEQAGVWIIYLTPKKVRLIEKFPIAKYYDLKNRNDESLKQKFENFKASLFPIDRIFFDRESILADPKRLQSFGLYTFFLDRAHQFMIAYAIEGDTKVRKKMAFPPDPVELFGEHLPPRSKSKKPSIVAIPRDCTVCGKTSTTPCTKCNIQLYCSNKCRKHDYRKHRCKKFITDPEQKK